MCVCVCVHVIHTIQYACGVCVCVCVCVLYPLHAPRSRYGSICACDHARRTPAYVTTGCLYLDHFLTTSETSALNYTIVPFLLSSCQTLPRGHRSDSRPLVPGAARRVVRVVLGTTLRRLARCYDSIRRQRAEEEAGGSRSIMNVWRHTSGTRHEGQDGAVYVVSPVPRKPASSLRTSPERHTLLCVSFSVGGRPAGRRVSDLFSIRQHRSEETFGLCASRLCHTAVECTYSYACRTLARGSRAATRGAPTPYTRPMTRRGA